MSNRTKGGMQGTCTVSLSETPVSGLVLRAPAMQMPGSLFLEFEARLGHGDSDITGQKTRGGGLASKVFAIKA